MSGHITESLAIALSEYDRQVSGTDRLPHHDLRPVLLGLFGEVGSILTTAKKHYREEDEFEAYRNAVDEEFGDAFWYFAALCRRLGLSLDQAFSFNRSEGSGLEVIATDLSLGPIAQAQMRPLPGELEPILLELGCAAAALSVIPENAGDVEQRLQSFAQIYEEAVRAARVSFARALHLNMRKVRGRFLEPDIGSLPTFDIAFPEDERIPVEFEINIVQRRNGQTYLRLNDVFIGDPLTDNITDRDGYRFHDVFHFSHAATLNWSPVFRALLKRKRKSDSRTDEEQDGGRAIVVEEGLTAWIFSRAKEDGFFQKRHSLPFGLLKTVGEFVAGYEVDQCPLRLWEMAILKGYEIFCQVRNRGGGTVTGNCKARTISYRP
jgi:NTP pyrophosphatase (non-canonical NTP hydrolase)